MYGITLSQTIIIFILISVFSYFSYKTHNQLLFDKKIFDINIPIISVLLVISFNSIVFYVIPFAKSFFGIEHKVQSINLSAMYLVNVLFLGPIVEEWIFRGCILRAYLTENSRIKSIFITSVFFALIHVNPIQILIAFILGCYFGYIFCKTNSITCTIILHIIANSVTIFWQYVFI